MQDPDEIFRRKDAREAQQAEDAKKRLEELQRQVGAGLESERSERRQIDKVVRRVRDVWGALEDKLRERGYSVEARSDLFDEGDLWKGASLRVHYTERTSLEFKVLNGQVGRFSYSAANAASPAPSQLLLTEVTEAKITEIFWDFVDWFINRVPEGRP